MKRKKEKITYIDDGRTIADMSALSGGKKKSANTYYGGYRGSAKDKWDTYWGAVKMMFLPMLLFVAALIIIYLVVFVLFQVI